MTREQYLVIREQLKELSEKIIDFGKGKFDYQSSGKKLNFTVNGKLLFENNSDADTLMDYMLYNSVFKGKRVLDSFYDSDIELNDTEELILEGMVNSKVSIYEVTKIDKERSILYLTDLLHSGTYELINVGFAESGVTYMLLCARLIDLENGVYMTSGASFTFQSESKDRLLADYSYEKFKRRRDLNSDDLFIFVYKKSKIYGVRTKYLDTGKSDYKEDLMKLKRGR